MVDDGRWYSARELTQKEMFDFKKFTIWGDLSFIISHHPPGSHTRCYFLLVLAFILIFGVRSLLIFLSTYSLGRISHFCLTGQMMWANVELNPSFLDATWMQWFERFFFGDSNGSRMGLVAYTLLWGNMIYFCVYIYIYIVGTQNCQWRVTFVEGWGLLESQI